MKGLFDELKRRNVIRVGLAYLALGWVVVQVTAIAIPALNLPSSLASIVFYLCLIGFPFAILLGWAYELTPEGVKRSSEVNATDSIRSDTGRRLERGIMGLLAVAVVILLVREFSGAPESAREAVVETPALVAEERAPVVAQASIAVLPFLNMSDDKDYFADGLSEELLNLLAQVNELKVAGRTSSFAFKGRNEDLREIGKVLGVTKVLEGSVRRSGNKLRITAQLVNVEDGFHIWSSTYDREMSDIFAIQDEIAASILKALKVKLGLEAPSRGMPTRNMEAYALYLEALTISQDYSKRQLAAGLLERAVELDPSFAEGWSSLGMNIFLAEGQTDAELLAKSLSYLEKAVELDPDDLSARLLLRFMSGNLTFHDGVLETFAGLVEEYPQIPFFRGSYISNLRQAGQLKKSLAVADAGLAIDPLLSGYMYQSSESLIGLQRYEDANEAAGIFAIQTGFQSLRIWFAMIQLHLGEEVWAREMVDDYVAQTGEEAPVIVSFLERLLDPQTTLATLDDPLRESYITSGESKAITRLRILLLIDSPHFWPEFDAAVSSVHDRTALVRYYIHYGKAWFLNDPRVREILDKDLGLVDFWRTNPKPDFCAFDGFESWICELNPDG